MSRNDASPRSWGLLAAGLLLLATAGCAHQRVKPWERNHLAERAMAVDPEPMASAFDDHIYFSKESASGGRGFGGGGCGCN